MSITRTLVARALAGLAVGLALGAGFDPARDSSDAGTALRLDTQGLVDRSERIVEGRVLSRRTIERLDGSLDTEYRLQVGRDFLGPRAGDDTVRLPGGVRADGSGMVIPGVPRMEVGEDALLFLGDSEAGRRLTVGLAQGRYTLLVDGDGVRRALRTGADTRLVGSARTAASAARGTETVPYAALAAEIEAAVNRRRAREGAGDER